MLDWILQAVQLPPGALQTPRDTLFRAQDSLAAAAGAVHDTLTAPPLPGGVAAMVRFVFAMPQAIQIGGAILGALVAVLALFLLWQRRVSIWTWLRTRSRQIQIVLAGTGLVLVCVAAFAGKTSWDYMQHDNGFCTGCHIMERPFGRFQVFAGKHEDLKCHNCHEQSLFASMRQLVLWVADRPTEIGKHAPVPNSRCETCHQQPGDRDAWHHVLQLAGHRVHFGSDSSVLKDLKCVTCHGAEIHHFIPSNRTCQQSGCHVNQSVKLAGMANLPTISCVTCHAFRADLPGLATLDSARHALIPSASQCRSCHEMETRPSGYIAAKDPHKGSCGYCHDVHTDTKPSDARTSCVKCHAPVVNNPFHSGANHRAAASNCLVCHQPHAASVDASDCVGCHTSVRQRGLFHPPLPFDTAEVLRRRISPSGGASSSPDEDQQPAAHREYRDLPPDEQPPIRAAPAVNPDDTFPHARHTSLPCLTCHTVNRRNGAYGLVFEIPRGCDLCHHQNLIAGAVTAQDCARCHQSSTLADPRPTTVAIAVKNRPPVPRTVAFRHDRHGQLECAACHRPPDPVPPDSVQRCTACHAQHHDAARDCTLCHNLPTISAAHTRTTHTGCDACHAASNIEALVPNRNFCLVCHTPQRTHKSDRECTTCHFLTSPAGFRPRLLRAGSG